MIEGSEQSASVVELPKAIEADCIEPLEDVALLPVPRGAAVLFDETLNLLEAGDNPLFARGAAALPLRIGLDAELVKKGVILVHELSHARPRPSFGRGRPRPRPCAFPRRPVM